MKGVTIFTEMSALAQEHGAVNLSQGFPDFELAPSLGNYIKEAFDKGYNQYAPMAGLPMLMESIALRIKQKYTVNLSPKEHLTITPGATYGIYCAIQSCVQAGDEVIVLEPAYDSYAPNIESAGGRVIPVALRKKDFSVNWQTVKDAITDRTKAIIINSPHNPTGQVWTPQDYQHLKEIVRDTKIVIIADEVYDHLTFENTPHHSILQDEELFARAYVVFSFGKVLQATGWKIGFVAAPANFTTAFRGVHQYVAFSVNSISQYAIAHYLGGDHGLDAINTFFEKKRDLMLSAFKDLPLQVPFKSMGSYFQLFSFKGLSTLSDRAYARMLTQDAGVASIPISPFYSTEQDTGLLRFCFAKNDATIVQAAEQLKLYYQA